MAAVLAAVAGCGVEAVAPLLARDAIDGAMNGWTADLPVLAAALAGIAVARYGATLVRRTLGARLSMNVQHDLREQVFRALHRLDGPQQDDLSTGLMMSRATSDLQSVQGLLGDLPLLVGNLVLVSASFGVMLWLSPPLTLIALVVIPAMVLLTGRTRRRLYPATLAVQRRTAEIARHVEETVTGVRVVKGFGQEDREVATMRSRASRLLGERLVLARLSGGLAAPLVALPAAGLIAVLGLGGVLSLGDTITVGTLVAFSAYVVNLVGPAKEIGVAVISAQLAKVGIERVYGLIDARPRICDPEQPLDLPDGPLGVEFDQVCFGYPAAGTQTLADVSVCVRPGETVAFIGSAGSGKSTLGMLVPRFYDPQAGEVRVGGVPLSRLRLSQLRRDVGMVFQDPFLFSDTVRANIAYGRPDAGEAEIRAAARAAQAEEFIDSLPAGFDTRIGQRGLLLSGGQRQRIALARALLNQPRVLVLDDATSAVDTATEAAIHARLSAATSATTIIMAHRRSSLAPADRVVVLDNGRVVDVGTEAELMRRGSLAVLDAETDGRDSRPAREKLWPSDASGTTADGGHLDDQDVTVPGTAVDVADDGADGHAAHGQGFSLSRLLRPVRFLVAIGMLLVAADTMATLAYPWLAGLVVDRGIVGHSPAVLAVACGGGLLVVAAHWLVVRWQTLVTARASESVLYRLRVRCYAHLQRLGLDYYETEPDGKSMARVTTDLDALSGFLQTGLLRAVISPLTVVGVSVVLVLVDVRLALVALTALPMTMIVLLLIRRRAASAYGVARDRFNELNADLHEKVTGLRVTQAYVREEWDAARFGVHNDAYRTARLRAMFSLAVYFPLVTLLSELSRAAVIVVGAGAVAGGSLSPGVFAAFLLYLGLLFSPLQQLSQVFDSYQQARFGVARISDLLRTRPSIGNDEAGRVEVPARLAGAVELENVGFRYPTANRDALTGISFRIEPGETVAFVGATGAGKSTVVKLLGRFYDATAGVVRVDGVDVSRYPLGDFRRRLGVVPQEMHLFSGTVAANIAYGRPDATRAEVENAARMVGALPMIAGLDGGFLHRVGERGQGLSAGQRQLIALARAELVDPDLLLMDEATANMDSATEAAVLAAGDRLAGRHTTPGAPRARKRRTTVLVAHRLTTAARADRIIVLADGRIAEHGTHDELLAAQGIYATLWRNGTGVLAGPVTTIEQVAAECPRHTNPMIGAR